MIDSLAFFLSLYPYFPFIYPLLSSYLPFKGSKLLASLGVFFILFKSFQWFLWCVLLCFLLACIVMGLMN